jgi:hypothetical protein
VSNLGGKCVKNCQFPVKIFDKICTIGRFLKKRLIEYFFIINMPFWNTHIVPKNTPSLVFFGKICIKSYRAYLGVEEFNILHAISLYSIIYAL